MMSSLERYNQWNEVKKRINNLEKNINIKNGNIYLVSVGQNIGNENYGKGEIFLRPVVVLKKLGHNYFVGIPLTSKEKNGSYFFKFKYKDKYSYAMFNQIRTFNSKRILKYHGKIKENDFVDLKENFRIFLCN